MSYEIDQLRREISQKANSYEVTELRNENRRLKEKVETLERGQGNLAGALQNLQERTNQVGEILLYNL